MGRPYLEGDRNQNKADQNSALTNHAAGAVLGELPDSQSDIPNRAPHHLSPGDKEYDYIKPIIKELV